MTIRVEGSLELIPALASYIHATDMHFFAIGTQVNPADLNRGWKVVGAYYIEAVHTSDLLIQPDIPIKVYMPGCITVDQLITAGEAATLKSLKSMALNPGAS